MKHETINKWFKLKGTICTILEFIYPKTTRILLTHFVDLCIGLKIVCDR